ncbi:MAG: putative thymidylate synthase [Prokaryotic dsDNA virus sp.]|jgi:thymidylate synthase ThyX|nr:MAG: putative thymidylate synthase [Prokaryotic dsDNA virus sp.]|tara:strand:- start:16520 stop:17398 length:879 start_codon:yes stop_codon:yes gene_type:complete
MTITAEVIADSMSPEGHRITTMQLRYPRFIHAEFMTHRVFSRNASSSRAIPVKKMIEDLRRDPAMPIYWGANQKGMQAGKELVGRERRLVEEAWLEEMEEAITTAQFMVESGLHKQIANRILEPWAHINVVVTATEWDNFFNLRAHPDAQPEIQQLALEMINAMAGSQPNHLKPGDWHLPYITAQEWSDQYYSPSQTSGWETLKRVSVARCARVSYLTHDGRETTIEEDLQLYDRLVGSTPIHASSTEHQATPDSTGHDTWTGWEHQAAHGNFVGWIQNRKLIEFQMNQGPS